MKFTANITMIIHGADNAVEFGKRIDTFIVDTVRGEVKGCHPDNTWREKTDGMFCMTLRAETQENLSWQVEQLLQRMKPARGLLEFRADMLQELGTVTWDRPGDVNCTEVTAA
jgi:hypothetical protein